MHSKCRLRLPFRRCLPRRRRATTSRVRLPYSVHSILLLTYEFVSADFQHTRNGQAQHNGSARGQQLNQNGRHVTHTSSTSPSASSTSHSVKSSPHKTPISHLTPNGNLPNQSTAITASVNQKSASQDPAHLQPPHHERNPSNASLVSAGSTAMPSHLPTGFIVAFHRKMVTRP